MTETRGAFTAAQVDQLLAPINPARVLRDGKGKAHVSQQDVTAHLTRVFGFGNWDTELLANELVFETARDDKGSRWDVCYRATMRLTVRDPNGNKVCQYEDGSTGTAQNQTRGDGHDLAMKSAISLALKRCAKSLGDQFGLSLYNKGQQEALVRGTLVHPEVEPDRGADMQEGVPQQVSLGTDETAYDHGLEPESGGTVSDMGARAQQRRQAPAAKSEPVRPVLDIESMTEQAKSSNSLDELRGLWKAAANEGDDVAGELRDEIMKRQAVLSGKSGPSHEAAVEAVTETLDAEVVEAS